MTEDLVVCTYSVPAAYSAQADRLFRSMAITCSGNS